MATVDDLKSELENDDLIQSRDVDITVEGRTLEVIEHGNPALEIDEENHTVIETGEDDVPERVEQYARELFSHNGYSCSVYANDRRTETKIVV